MRAPVGHCLSSDLAFRWNTTSLVSCLIFIFSSYFTLATTEKSPLQKQAFMERDVM